MPDGFVVAPWNILTTPSDASLTTPPNLRLAPTEAEPLGVTAALVTFVAVLAYVNVVVVGTSIILNVPLNVASTPVIVTTSPSKYV